MSTAVVHENSIKKLVTRGSSMASLRGGKTDEIVSSSTTTALQGGFSSSAAAAGSGGGGGGGGGTTSSAAAAAGGGSGQTNNNNNNNANTANQSSVKLKATRSIALICCAPCVFCRTSTIFRRTALTTLTLVVTSLLVISPILFLTQFALPARDCHRVHCIPKPHKSTPAMCESTSCINTGHGIQARMNWRADPCNDFEGYCCSNNHSISLYARIVRNSQETADNIIEHLIQQNTTSGQYRALGRLYGSCLRLKINTSATLRLTLTELGGFLPPGALPGTTITDLLVQFGKYGVVPIVK